MKKKDNQDSKKKKIIALIILIIIILILLLLFLKPKYDITFDSNGGTEISPFIVEKHGLITEPKDPIRKGYIFAGWYYNDELFDFSTPVTKDMELEARWVKLDEITGLKISPAELILKPGDKEKIVVTIMPSNMKINNVTWSSSNTNVAVVNENGNITAIGVGEAIITVTTQDGKHSATIKVVVAKDAVRVNGISLNKTNINLNVHDTYKLNSTVTPNNASNKSVTWSSSNPSVVSVDQNGNIKALKEGTAVITVTTNDGGYKASATVKVKAIRVNGVSLDKKNVSLFVNESVKLSSVVKPSNATNKSVTWSSSNPAVATVDANGNVKALSAGTTVITVRTNDGGYTAKCTITVKIARVTSVSLNKSSSTLIVGGTDTLYATISPSNAANKGITWSSSNPAVATVDTNGNIKAISKGTAVITVKTNDGGYTATCTVTVNEKVANYSVIIEKKVIDVINATYQYSISVTKDGASFSGYDGISYNGFMIAKGQFLASSQYNGDVTSAKVYINGAQVNAKVIYR